MLQLVQHWKYCIRPGKLYKNRNSIGTRAVSNSGVFQQDRSSEVFYWNVPLSDTVLQREHKWPLRMTVQLTFTQQGQQRQTLYSLQPTILYLCFNGLFPGGPGLAGIRVSQLWILLELRVMEVVVTTGAIRRAKL